jgi:hypothetical protein
MPLRNKEPTLISDFSGLFRLISRAQQDISHRYFEHQLRLSALSEHTRSPMVKIAFDTRHIDRQNTYNPRRGLQYYHRSQPYLPEEISSSVNGLSKLRAAVRNIQMEHGSRPEWQDSYARVLLSTLDNGLRTITGDRNYTSHQPGMGSLGYIRQMLHVRYRLSPEQLNTLSEQELRKIVLGKDEGLLDGIKPHSNEKTIARHQVAEQGYDRLMEKLFGGLHASEEHPDIERSITVIIRERFHKDGQ